MSPADLDCRRSEQSCRIQMQYQPISFNSSASVKSEMEISNELSLSVPVNTATSMASTPTEVDADELKQIGNPNSGMLSGKSDHRGLGPVSSDDGWIQLEEVWTETCERMRISSQLLQIYKGTHDHPKPQPSRQYSSGNIMSGQEERSDKVSSLNGRDEKPSSIYGQIAHSIEPNSTVDLSPVTAKDDTLDEVEDDDPFSKRRSKAALRLVVQVSTWLNQLRWQHTMVF